MKIITGIIILLITVVAFGCVAKRDTLHGNKREFNFMLKYGVGAKNIINTYDDTYTKDMIKDSSITIKLVLSPAELDSIFKAFNKIDVFSYPDFFNPYSPGRKDPFTTYRLYIQIGERKKTILWGDYLFSTVPEAVELRKVFRMIIEMVESKDEVKDLPRASGGYM